MHTVIFQAAKLGDIPQVLAELDRAAELLAQDTPAQRVYGISAGALTALAFALFLSAQADPPAWGNARTALEDFSGFLRRAHSRDLRSLNPNPWYGFFNLRPLRLWVASRLQIYTSIDTPANLKLSQLAIPTYLCTIDRDGTFTLFGPPDPPMQFQYYAVQVGPPQDAPILDALIAALSTMLSTEPVLVNGQWYRDCRPVVVDAGAIIYDMQASAPSKIVRTHPYAPICPWKQNWVTSSFIMHSQNERNQTILASCYLDLQSRHQLLRDKFDHLFSLAPTDLQGNLPTLPILSHVDLPYIGSTEAFTNMRQSVQNKAQLINRFQEILQGQLDHFRFDLPANLIYGAGGFSGILGGLVTTRAVDAGFERSGGQIQQIYGVSAGVLNGFFHAVQLAAARFPDLYRPAARNALADLEGFIANIQPNNIARFNLNPLKFWQGWANLSPLEEYLLERLAAYTGSKHPGEITFNDIGLPMTVTAARLDGFTDFFGMTGPNRHMTFAGREWQVLSTPIVRAIIAGWSMNTYIIPTKLGDQSYTDGGGTFYDVGLFAACMDPVLTNLLNIHLDEPENHTFNLPPRPNLLRIIFDTHNYYFPEEHRRMRLLTDLLYQHYQLRGQYSALQARLPAEISSPQHALPPDFRRDWHIDF
jgi:predicted acylesterase/phospholipase RssA